jgi:RimJ/RimL family protein N-acetyltransferase
VIAAPPFDEQKVEFRPIAAADLETLRTWRNLDRVREWMFDPHPISPQRQQAWWRERAHDPLYRQYVLAYDGAGLGSISFTIEANEPLAVCGYYVGAEPAPPRSGTLLMYEGLRAAFRAGGIETVECNIFPGNELSIRLVRRFGFAETAQSNLRLHVFRLGRAGFDASEALVRELLFAESGARAVR